MLSVRWSAWKVLFSHFSTNSMQARPSHSYFQHILIQKKLHLFCLLICLNVPRWIITNEMFSCGNSLSMACQNDQNASNIFLHQYIFKTVAILQKRSALVRWPLIWWHNRISSFQTHHTSKLESMKSEKNRLKRHCGPS